MAAVGLGPARLLVSLLGAEPVRRHRHQQLRCCSEQTLLADVPRAADRGRADVV